ncbi:hypothetical protein [Iamia sp.]|uniref:hypothetical protein n=1 Tax=Iamia sp. TaxID=2722710 RepID=UPI002C7221BE|nr:hypothetical protein [Iamia sp.]HXH56636.1 hypothetical protein [Iamia sp.]
MSSPAEPPTRGAAGSPGGAPAGAAQERRSLLVAGAAFFGVLVVLIVVAALFAGGAGDEQTSSTRTTEACTPDDAACRTAQQSPERPGIIPRPGEGQAPSDPGDPGGWAQVTLFGLIVVAIAVIIGLVVRSARRARSRGAPSAST